MKKELIPVWLILFCCSLQTKAQFYNQRPSFLNSNSHMLFWKSGVDFSVAPPQTFTMAPQLVKTGWWYESLGTVSLIIADPRTAAPRFATTSTGCYDHNMQLFPNGDSLVSYAPGFGRYVILRFPGDTSKYYRFDINFKQDESKPPKNLSYINYSIMDLSLNNGLGDIAPAKKNLPLSRSVNSSFTVREMMAIPGNNCDAWLVARFAKDIPDGNASHYFQCYHIDVNGVNPQPQVSDTFGNFEFGVSFFMALSPDRRTIAFPQTVSGNKIRFRLLQFDPENGKLSLGVLSQYTMSNITADTVLSSYVFSPDGRKLILCLESSVSFNNMSSFTVLDLNDKDSIGKEETSLPNPFYSYHYHDSTTLSMFGNELPTYMRSYGGNIYFNINKDSTYPSYYSPGKDSLDAKVIAMGVMKPSAQGWSAPAFNAPIALSGEFGPPHTLEIILPLDASDTFADHYKDTVFCGDPGVILPTFQIDARPGFSGYIWDDGSPGPSRSVNHAGKYWVTYQGVCNARIDTITVSIKPQQHILPPDTVVCEQRIPFTLVAGPADGYLWDNDATTASISVYHTGKYGVTFLKAGCYQSDTISVAAQYCPCHVSVPNAFSPNDDGLNDFFKPVIALGCVPSEYSLRIFNRWGQVVYGSFNEMDKGWNGWDKGRQADAGTYFYEFRFKSHYLDKDYIKKGELILLR